MSGTDALKAKLYLSSLPHWPAGKVEQALGCVQGSEEEALVTSRCSVLPSPHPWPLVPPLEREGPPDKQGKLFFAVSPVLLAQRGTQSPSLGPGERHLIFAVQRERVLDPPLGLPEGRSCLDSLLYHGELVTQPLAHSRCSQLGK